MIDWLVGWLVSMLRTVVQHVSDSVEMVQSPTGYLLITHRLLIQNHVTSPKQIVMDQYNCPCLYLSPPPHLTCAFESLVSVFTTSN